MDPGLKSSGNARHHYDTIAATFLLVALQLFFDFPAFSIPNLRAPSIITFWVW